MKEKTIFIYDRTLAIVLLIIFVLLGLSSLSLIIIGIFEHNCLIVGIILFFFLLVLFLALVFGKTVLNLITINNESITLKTIFGKIIKKHNWSDLRHCEIKILTEIRPSGKYICLLFNDAEITSQRYRDLDEDENIIVLFYNKKNYELINSVISSMAK